MAWFNRGSVTNDYAPAQGIVVYIRPRGWAMVGLLRGGTVLYREGFWVDDLTEVV